jgi:hypothetical protein
VEIANFFVNAELSNIFVPPFILHFTSLSNINEHVNVCIADVAGQGHKNYQSVVMWPGTIQLFHPKLLVRNRNHISVSLQMQRDIPLIQ